MTWRKKDVCKYNGSIHECLLDLVVSVFIIFSSFCPMLTHAPFSTFTSGLTPWQASCILG